MRDELMAGSAAPMRIRVWKMLTDIAERHGTKQGVAQGMQENVAVGVRDDTVAVRHAHASLPHMVARTERVHIETKTDAWTEVRSVFSHGHSSRRANVTPWRQSPGLLAA